ncbi:MAG: Gfo/Idh/MocA family oxidoreductase [Gemmatimonadetes bacterium]|nr:Gfo/Idh/MocA family oxidoreductase [Gemmatimonadota bacterium]
MNIGVVGAETHTAQLCEIVNLQRRIRGVRVSHVCGRTLSAAREAAAAGGIPHIARKPEDLIGAVDAVVVDHIHGRHHLPAAKPLLEAGLPIFFDKPFCCSRSGGRRFLVRAAELGVPVCSFSVMPMQSAFVALKKQVRRLGEIHAAVCTGPCDIASKYGGIFFYGIHQVEMILRLLGYGVGHAQVVKGSRNNHLATLTFKDGRMAAMHLMGEGGGTFHLSVIGARGRIDQAIGYDEDFFFPGVRSFVRMFRTGRTEETMESMLVPVAVLEALEKSLATGGRVRVS